MSDLDTRIRAFVGELVETSPLPPPFPDLATPGIRRPPSRRRVVLVLAVLALTFGATAAALLVNTRRGTEVQVRVPPTTAELSPLVGCPAAGRAPNGHTFGTAPVDPTAEGLDANQALAATPDYVAVSYRGQLAGYASKADLLKPNFSTATVYSCDLVTVVGNFVSGTGFVPLAGVPQLAPRPAGTRGILGIGLTDGAGVRVTQAIPGSPAAHAGLSAGDTITDVDGVRVTTIAGMNTALANPRAGDTVRVDWIDNAGRHHQAEVQLAPQHT